ncbi:carbohydrate ABC transporter membrane protein 1 (CUT1 family) [Kineothrix alysoides]|uniref:Carbohydrate ABC transporter membrane protein 1 (CUT1 family) n=1 Tax=Kineothrix alysoides TaxID=1469948 RepID=A0A4R1R6B0_9FIRM|nr:sugar ABC transporter permease [Kineothrix alysoides]TCL61095.1 carbohydrate ABC transporter membrane protein 1 (CUT1 family) [Kineothrix alysoides]
MEKRKGRKKRRGAFIFCCVAPATILMFLFMIMPTFNVFKMSLYKWGGFSAEKTFVGIENFKKLAADEKFLRSMQNSILIIVVVTVITMALAIVFAAVLSRQKLKGQGFFRVVFYIPNILSIVVISAIFSAIYDQRDGLLNTFIYLFRPVGENGEGLIAWLGNQKLVIWAIVIALIWQAIGYYMVMYMASMASVPESIYESASIEGAGGITQFFTMTLPLIWSNIRTTLTFFIISTINLSFMLVKAMTGGGPDGASDVFLNYMYSQAYTNSSYGYGMAIGVVVFIFSFALSGIVNAVTKRETLEF